LEGGFQGGVASEESIEKRILEAYTCDKACLEMLEKMNV
jgi:hypothetical protein